MKKLICSLMVAMMACGSLVNVGAMESNERFEFNMERSGHLNIEFKKIYRDLYPILPASTIQEVKDGYIINFMRFQNERTFFVPFDETEAPVIEEGIEGDMLFRFEENPKVLEFIPGDENIYNDNIEEEDELISACIIYLTPFRVMEYPYWKREDLNGKQRWRIEKNFKIFEKCKVLKWLKEREINLKKGQVALVLDDETIQVVSRDMLRKIAIEDTVESIIDSEGKIYDDVNEVFWLEDLEKSMEGMTEEELFDLDLISSTDDIFHQPKSSDK